MNRPSIVAATLAALLAGCAAPPPLASTPAPGPAPGPAPAASAPTLLALGDPAPDAIRWTYGSGEAAAASIQAWRALADFAIASAARKPGVSVPMGLPGAPGGVATTSCADKQPAVVLDVDETVILNRGYEYWLARGNAGSGAAFTQWATEGAAGVVPVPGAVAGIRRLRDAGIAVIFNTNRPSSVAAGTIRALEVAGAGTAVHGQDLFLAGDDALGGNKDGRRATIAARYCVVALGGDNLGDFANVLNDPALAVHARRDLAARGELAALWGNGWFLIPNSAYGAWQKGSIADIFPPEARWEPQTPTVTTEDK